jgi:pimeloyl-ACP methyl ester carboxylesterase
MRFRNLENAREMSDCFVFSFSFSFSIHFLFPFLLFVVSSTDCFHLAAAEGPSGEFVLPSLFYLGGWARSPLCRRIPALKMPVDFLYGESDWMDPNPALHLAQDNPNLRVYIVPNCGHQVFVENREGFSEVMEQVLNEQIPTETFS